MPALEQLNPRRTFNAVEFDGSGMATPTVEKFHLRLRKKVEGTLIPPKHGGNIRKQQRVICVRRWFRATHAPRLYLN
ncbi:hypothetical protein CEXT_196821 [Caerostris extrusa]|uniref:Uncharacterized protein n=1 Tax=Caerostris extrusa TaxID=172846 RepID=A0AAV4Y7G2_CAEEX|nr:hypothetical protein CEXT_196821 [Caerostris extrusa]